MNDKISEHHLLRKAFVYVRQSSTHQVRHHVQGRQRQYDLADRARELGFAQTVVIDEDQGRSGSGLAERPGFVRLLTAVCAGEAGAVFALEASRLARNNRDCATPTIPVATGTAQSVRALPRAGGSPSARPNCCRSSIFMWSTRCPPSSAASRIRTRP